LRHVDPEFAERKAARSASAFECLDDDHAAAAAWASSGESAGASLGERERRGRTTSGKREPSCGAADEAISIMM
jgi:hypothetical protein